MNEAPQIPSALITKDDREIPIRRIAKNDLLKALIPPSVKIVDIGCGPNPLFWNKSTNVDRNTPEMWIEKMIRQKKQGIITEKHADEQIEKLKKLPNFVQSQAEKLPFGNLEYDYAIMSEIFEHVDNPLEVLNEAQRVAKMIIFTVPNEHQWHIGLKPFTHADHKRFFNEQKIYELLSNANINRDYIQLIKINVGGWSHFLVSILSKYIKPAEEELTKTIKIYMVRQDEWGSHVGKDYRPYGNRWKNIESIDNFEEAEYLIIISHPVVSFPSMFPPEKTLYFIAEPTEFNFTKAFWQNIPPNSHKFPVEEYGIPMFWHNQMNYDELKNSDFPEKTKNLSWVTTSFGDGFEPPGCQVLSGHKLRMNFLKTFLNKYPDKLDLYGRKMTRYLIPSNIKHFGGELWDKYDGLKDYRYSIGIENSMQKNYITAKFADAVLAGCTPLYWGCPNIKELFPDNSYVWIDIEKPDEAVEQVIQIINSDYREQHLKELREAKRLILDKFNMWECIYQAVNKIHNF